MFQEKMSLFIHLCILYDGFDNILYKKEKNGKV